MDDRAIRVTKARDARKNGLMSLEDPEIKNPFMKKGFQLAADGNSSQILDAILKVEIVSILDRHKNGRNIFLAIGDIAPAFGMIGTLIGLVQMLVSMSDPSSIGPAMAVAILTTLYGALVANVVALPIAEKLKIRSAEEVAVMQMILQGIVGIVDGEHPNIIQERLIAFIEPKWRDNAMTDGKAKN